MFYSYNKNLAVDNPNNMEKQVKPERKRLVPFQSGIYENMNVHDEDELPANTHMDNSVKGYVAPGKIKCI